MLAVAVDRPIIFLYAFEPDLLGDLFGFELCFSSIINHFLLPVGLCNRGFMCHPFNEYEYKYCHGGSYFCVSHGLDVPDDFVACNNLFKNLCIARG